MHGKGVNYHQVPQININQQINKSINQFQHERQESNERRQYIKTKIEIKTNSNLTTLLVSCYSNRFVVWGWCIRVLDDDDLNICPILQNAAKTSEATKPKTKSQLTTMHPPISNPEHDAQRPAQLAPIPPTRGGLMLLCPQVNRGEQPTQGLYTASRVR